MKALGLIKPNLVAWIEKEKPIAGPYDAIIRPIAIAPCSSDVHTAFEGGAEKPSGFVLGHEAVGEIVEVGELVNEFKVGDKVVVPAGTPNWRARGIQEHNFKHAGGPFSGLELSGSRDGVFAELFMVNDADNNLALMPEDISIDDALMTVDMVTTGFSGAELADIKFGDTVCVIGIGPVGLMAVAGAKLRGAARIFAVGTRPDCVALAKEYGATDIISYKDGNIAKQVLELTSGRGTDATIIAGGNAETFALAVAMTRFGGGNIANINYFTGSEYLPIPTLAFGRGMAGKTIKGDLCEGGRVRIERLLNMIRYGRIQPGKMVTHKFYGFDKLEEAFYVMRDKPKDLIKAVVYIDWNKEK
ncbi:NADP-dependent alcohol dehydrogenase [Clostridiales bacterium oral taxon 876 str. F0540]|nr:NADP-dependent alcohol dehydrogenase [Clostridiales bacterium oral taxon 876 str. F0540]